MECGCIVSERMYEHTITYCPLHAAAEELVEKLEKARKMLEQYAGEFEDASAAYLALDIENLIAKAEGKSPA